MYVDESGFYKSNGNLKMWRKSGQTIYYDIKDNIKLNLLLAVTQSKVLHYKIVNENIDSGKIEEFLGELCEKLTDDEKKLLPNYSKLTNSEAQYNKLVEDNKSATTMTIVISSVGVLILIGVVVYMVLFMKKEDK